MTRTADPLQLDASRGFPIHLRNADGALLAEIGDKEWAERIKVALDVVRGTPTEDLKAIQYDHRHRHEILIDMVAMTKERDRLLEALKPFAEAYEQWSGGNAPAHFSEAVVPANFRDAAQAYANCQAKEQPAEVPA